MRAGVLGISLAATLLGGQVGAQTQPAPRLPIVNGTLDFARGFVATEEPAAAGLPVLIRFSIPNTTAEDAQLLLTGPGEYLEASRFEVVLSAPGQQPLTIRPYNGQFTSGLTSRVTVTAGQNLVAPLATDPLAPGTYRAELRTVEDWNKQPGARVATFKIDVVADEKVRARWIEKRIAEVRRNDPFAASVSLKNRVEPVIDAMLEDVAGDDPSRAAIAATLLTMYYPYPFQSPPEKWSQATMTGLRKHVDDPMAILPGHRSPAAAILSLAWKNSQEQFLPLILEYSRSQDPDVRDVAIMAMQSFNQTAASDRLMEVLNSSDPSQHVIAAHALLSRGDSRAVPKAGKLALGGDTPLFDLLVMFPDHAIARQTVDAALASSDPSVRAAIERALHPFGGMVDPVDRRSVPPAIANLSTMDAVRVLLKTEDFTVIDESTAATAPPNVIAFRRLQQSSGSFAAMNRLYLSGTPAAKLYALCGFYMQSDRELAVKAETLSNLREEVSVMDGQRRISLPPRQLVEKIVSGDYPQRLLRLYPATNPAAP